MEAGVAKRQLLLLLAAVVLLRLPFLNQAVQGDDPIYLTEAAHALIDPLHPNDVKYVFMGDVVDLRGHSHPPGNAWPLAGMLLWFGEVREAPFHAAYLAFSLMAAAAMWSLARRFSERPMWASLLFLAVPAFVVNGGSLEADLPFLALWMASVALFCTGRLWWAAAAMAVAAMMAYQAVLLTPILAVFVCLFHRRSRAHWLVLLTPLIVVAGWQVYSRSTTGAMPAAVLSGYFTKYGFQRLQEKLANALMLAIHSWFIVFPLLVPPAAVLAWQKRREPATLFLLAWIAIFFAGALAIFFAGSARYLLPMAAPMAILASRLPARWLAPAFAAQMALSLALAAANYQHWDACRQFARGLRAAEEGHRIWIDAELGLRHYVQADGGLPLRRGQALRAGDIVVSSELEHSVEVPGPRTLIAQAEVRPANPLRLIGLDSHSGYSTVSRGFWPFGAGGGVIDRLRAVEIVERHPTLEFVPMNSPEAADQIVSGIYGLDDNRFRWMAGTGVLALKSPSGPKPLRVDLYIPDAAAARRVTLLLDGREVAAQGYGAPGQYTLESPPVRGTEGAATLTIQVDRTFRAPGDNRELGIVLTGAGFAP